MLDIRSFVVSESKVYKCLRYYGSKHYYIYDSGNYYTLVVVEILSNEEEKEEEAEKYACSSLSSAIASIETLEIGGNHE